MQINLTSPNTLTMTIIVRDMSKIKNLFDRTTRRGPYAPGGMIKW